MPTSSSNESIIVNGISYTVLELTEYGFVTNLELPAGEKKGNGTFVFGDERLELEFRVRRVANGNSVCSFFNLSIDATAKIKAWLKKRHRQNDGGLQDRTYDELASGITEASVPAGGTATNSGAATHAAKGNVKTFALLVMLLAGLGMLIVALVFMRSRNLLSVSHSALVGNCLRVNSKVAGEISEVLVREGEAVRKGDVLIRLNNPELSTELEMLLAQCGTAKAKVSALKRQKEVFADKLKFAGKKLDLERQVAVSELQAATKAVKSAKLGYDRLVPFVRSGAVTQLELDEVENLWLAEESNFIAKENLVRQIDFAIDAAKNDVLILGDRVDDELGRIEADLTVAEAELIELEQTCEIASAREKELEIVAPRDGIVYVNYRQRGEFIKVADELIGISYPGETWAAGQVTAGQASRVLPGQPVKISVPSMKRKIEGVVMAVGHRAMYSKGNYNAEFRGATATDVPVKVYIKDLPEKIPSGIRLEMAIQTGYGIKWLDDAMGYKHVAIGSQADEEPNESIEEAETTAERLAAVKINQDL